MENPNRTFSELCYIASQKYGFEFDPDYGDAYPKALGLLERIGAIQVKKGGLIVTRLPQNWDSLVLCLNPEGLGGIEVLSCKPQFINHLVRFCEYFPMG